MSAQPKPVTGEDMIRWLYCFIVAVVVLRGLDEHNEVVQAIYLGAALICIGLLRIEKLLRPKGEEA